jgi:hypothetical protein
MKGDWPFSYLVVCNRIEDSTNDLFLEPEPATSSSHRHRRHDRPANRAHSYDSSSSILQADDEGDEADSELHIPHLLPNNSQIADPDAFYTSTHPNFPKLAKQYSSRTSNGENPLLWLKLDMSLIYSVADLQHDSEYERTRKHVLLYAAEWNIKFICSKHE